MAPSTLLYKFMVATLLILITICCVAWAATKLYPAAPRTLTIAIGDTIAEVAAKSTYPLNTAILTDDDLSAADRPVQLIYTGPGAIVLPSTRTVAITSVATIVTGIESAPQFDYIGQDDVADFTDNIETRLIAAGWQPDHNAQGILPRDELAQQLADPAVDEVTAWHLKRYSIGDTVLTLRLRRLHGIGPVYPHGAYLLNLLWRNDRLFDRAGAIARRLRQEDSVSLTPPRPVDAKTYGDRVRTLLSTGESPRPGVR